jgi:hypothetical protein
LQKIYILLGQCGYPTRYLVFRLTGYPAGRISGKIFTVSGVSLVPMYSLIKLKAAIPPNHPPYYMFFFLERNIHKMPVAAPAIQEA